MRTGEYYQRMADIPGPEDLKVQEHSFTTNREIRRKQQRRGRGFTHTYSRELSRRLGEQFGEHFEAKRAMKENERLAQIAGAAS